MYKLSRQSNVAQKSTYKDGNEWHRITAYITKGKHGMNITLKEAVAKMEYEE